MGLAAQRFIHIGYAPTPYKRAVQYQRPHVQVILRDGARAEIGEPLRGFSGLTSGIPQPWLDESGQNDPPPRTDRSKPAAPKKKPRKRKP